MVLSPRDKAAILWEGSGNERVTQDFVRKLYGGALSPLSCSHQMHVYFLPNEYSHEQLLYFFLLCHFKTVMTLLVPFKIRLIKFDNNKRSLQLVLYAATHSRYWIIVNQCTDEKNDNCVTKFL